MNCFATEMQRTVCGDQYSHILYVGHVNILSNVLAYPLNIENSITKIKKLSHRFQK
jgi:hypothetical protein